METKGKKNSAQNFRPTSEPQGILFASAPDASFTIGVVTDAEPSSLSLLAAGVAGMAARRARQNRLKK